MSDGKQPPTRGGSARGTSEQEIAFGRLHLPTSEATPAGGEASWPGLVLVHDVWGRTEHSRELGQWLAQAGFAVVEIHLYRAMADPRVEDPGERIRSLDDRAVLSDLDAAAVWLAGEAVCLGRRIGVIGVCMGGTFSLLAACHSKHFAAAAPFYGLLSYDRGMFIEKGGRDRARKPSSPIESAPRLRMPLLASFACEDTFVPESDVDLLEAALARSGQHFRVDRYAGAGHAFLNATRPDAYRPELAALARGRAVDFLREQLA